MSLPGIPLHYSKIKENFLHHGRKSHSSKVEGRVLRCERERGMPNIIFIMTDNQGAWPLGCYGNPEIRTPNIDQLADGGIRFSNAYCVNSVCSPSRATFFTCLISSQHGVHSYLGGEKPYLQMRPDAYCTIREFANLPRILSDTGYDCGLSGKGASR